MKKIRNAKASLSITVLLCSLLSIGELNADHSSSSSSVKKMTLTAQSFYNLRIDVQDPEGRELGSVSYTRSSNDETMTFPSELAENLVDGCRIIFTKESGKPFVYIMRWDGNRAVVENDELNLKIEFERLNEKVRMLIAERDVIKASIEEAVKKTIKDQKAKIKKKINERLKDF